MGKSNELHQAINQANSMNDPITKKIFSLERIFCTFPEPRLLPQEGVHSFSEII